MTGLTATDLFRCPVSPRRIGYVALETAYNILEGEEINDVVWTELGLLTAKDADSFEAE